MWLYCPIRLRYGLNSFFMVYGVRLNILIWQAAQLRRQAHLHTNSGKIQLKSYIVYPIVAAAATPVSDSPFWAAQKWCKISIGLISSKLGFKCSCSSCTNISICLYNGVHKVQQLIGRWPKNYSVIWSKALGYTGKWFCSHITWPMEEYFYLDIGCRLRSHIMWSMGIYYYLI